MKRNLSNGMAGLLVVLVAGIAHAETRLAVQDAAGVVDKFVVTEAGHVGVGTDLPKASIHVKASGGFPENAIKVEGSELNKGGGFLGYSNRSDGQLSRSGDRLGFIFFGSSSNVLTQHPAGFAANAEADWTTGSWPAYFAFQTTASGSTTRIERLRITSAGNIAINTTAPQATLDVNGSFRINPGNTLPASGVAVSKPACSSSNRGAFWFTQGTGVVKDTLEICAADGTTVDWRIVY